MEMFFRRKENKRKEGRRGRLGLLVWSATGALLSTTLALYLFWHHLPLLAGHLRDALLDHSYFSLREIRVRGDEKVGGSEVVAMAGLSHGMNIWKIDPARIETKVASHPWVKRVLVRREFPHRIVIEVEERVARGIVVVGKLYYVDLEGFVFKEVGEGEKVDFPFLTGLQQEELAAHAQSSRLKIQEALRLADLVGKGALALSEIHFRPSGGVVAYSMAYPVALHLGWGDWQAKVKRLERVLAMWKGREDRLAALDLSFRDQVVARLKNADRKMQNANFKMQN